MEKRKKSQKQERRITKSLQEIKEEARQTMSSGAIWFNKSDVVSKNFRIEAKTRTKPSKSITIKKEWLEKIEKEAFLTGKTPALAFSFGDGKDYFILTDKDFYEIVERLGTDYE
jgi:Holliday junction resolvase